MKVVVRRLKHLVQRAWRCTPSLEVTVALAVIATLAAGLFYVAGSLSPELALLSGR